MSDTGLRADLQGRSRHPLIWRRSCVSWTRPSVRDHCNGSVNQIPAGESKRIAEEDQLSLRVHDAPVFPMPLQMLEEEKIVCDTPNLDAKNRTFIPIALPKFDLGHIDSGRLVKGLVLVERLEDAGELDRCRSRRDAEDLLRV